MGFFLVANLWSDNLALILDIVLSVLLIGGMVFLCIKAKLTFISMISVFATLLMLVISDVFTFPVLKDCTLITFGFVVIYLGVMMTKPEKENLFRKNKRVKSKDVILTANETDELFENLNKSVIDLSASKTGALITIERADDMESFLRTSGTKIDAYVTPELLKTIFYVGTALHDGATIIRGNKILYSAVFYQPSQKPLNGKYGSRHRAAIGISEVCDALTIVVSEETGKVSFAFKGELIPVPVTEFLDKLKEYYYQK